MTSVNKPSETSLNELPLISSKFKHEAPSIPLSVNPFRDLLMVSSNDSSENILNEKFESSISNSLYDATSKLQYEIQINVKPMALLNKPSETSSNEHSLITSNLLPVVPINAQPQILFNRPADTSFNEISVTTSTFEQMSPLNSLPNFRLINISTFDTFKIIFDGYKSLINYYNIFVTSCHQSISQLVSQLCSMIESNVTYILKLLAICQNANPTPLSCIINYCQPKTKFKSVYCSKGHLICQECVPLYFLETLNK